MKEYEIEMTQHIVRGATVKANSLKEALEKANSSEQDADDWHPTWGSKWRAVKKEKP